MERGVSRRAPGLGRRGASPTAWLVRTLVSAVLGGLGLVAAQRLLDAGVLVGPNNLLYLTLVGVLIGYLVSAPLANRAAERMQRFTHRVSQIPPEAVLAAGGGATVALVIAVLLNNVLAAVPGFTWFWSLIIAAVLVAASSWFFVANRRLLGFTPSRAVRAGTVHSGRPKLVDTSAIIDGRLVDIAEANFIDGAVLVPAFVLGELQNIADDGDPLRRRRGRRGLEVLERLSQLEGVHTEIIHDPVPDAREIDEKLVRLSQRRSADLITTDYNLNQVAQLQGVRVLNVHQLANAVKASVLPGERLALTVVRSGREPGQGLAYLEDGTMVVIEDAADQIGSGVDAVVTSSLQTNMGRMIFARLDGPS